MPLTCSIKNPWDLLVNVKTRIWFMLWCLNFTNKLGIKLNCQQCNCEGWDKFILKNTFITSPPNKVDQEKRKGHVDLTFGAFLLVFNPFEQGLVE
jgi:hypothetical protein